MAPKRKTGKSSKSQKKRKTTARKPNQDNIKEIGEIQDEIILIITFAVSILLFLSNFNLCGAVGKKISDFFFGMFGAVAYIVPIVMFFTIAFYLSNIGNNRALRKIISAMIFFIALAAFIQLFANSEPYTDIMDYYKYSSEGRNGGGLIGGLLSMILCSLFEQVAAIIILLAIMAISIILLTGKAIFSYIASKSKDSIKERVEYQKLRREERERYDSEERRGESGRRPAKTFIINETSPTSLKASEPEKEHKVTSIFKRNKKEKAGKDEPETAAADFHTLFEDTREEAREEPVPPYEEELQLKFDSSEPEIWKAPEPEVSFYDTHVEKEETQVEKVESQEELPIRSKPEKASSGNQGQDSKSTDVESKENILDIGQASALQKRDYCFPPANLLSAPKPKHGKGNSDKDLKETALKLQNTLESFGVHVTVTNVSVGPAVTRYELQPEQGVKVSRITSLADDIKLNLATSDVRIEAPIPGKAAVGIEVPNKENSMVAFREMIESREFAEHSSNLAFAVGKDIGGQTIITDIAKMPHLLIAGATGSGKSVCINTLIMSILYKSKPDDVRMIMVDPKVVELSVYNGIPHLLIPVVTDPKKASAALNWAVVEMMERYKKFADAGVRDMKGYNEKISQLEDLNDESCQKLPQIIIIIDELADLMMVAPGEVEDAICRLAQLARAAGIHLIIATQRPSVNVITGLIKANIPSRIAFAVSSAIDSRTIIDGSGAEKLLGKGDMLFFPSGYPKPVRIQGAFISDKEVSAVVDFLKQNNSEAEYSDDIHDKINNAKAGDLSLQGGDSDKDEYFAEAGKFIIEKDKASIGMLQRVYKIGFNRAARIMDQLADAGVVGPEEGTKPRKVLMSQEQFEQYLEEN